MREEKEFGKKDDGENDDKGKEKAKKEKKKSEDVKNKKGDKSGDDDGVKEKDANVIKTTSSENESRDSNKSQRWWEFYKKSE